jgi:membrane-associated phospholipid phosphatase
MPLVETREGYTDAPGRAHWLRALGVAVGILALSGLLAAVSSYAIQALYPDRPMPPDLLFDLLPHLPWTQFVVEAVYFAGAVLLGIYAFRRENRERIPEIIALFGLMEIGRALIIVLTPLAPPYDAATHVVLHESIRNWGEFPSGHAGTMILFYLIVDRETAPAIKRTLAALLAVEVLFLLTSHSHYSIDIVGGLLLGYFVYYVYRRSRAFAWLRRLLAVRDPLTE